MEKKIKKKNVLEDQEIKEEENYLTAIRELEKQEKRILKYIHSKLKSSKNWAYSIDIVSDDEQIKRISLKSFPSIVISIISPFETVFSFEDSEINAEVNDSTIKLVNKVFEFLGPKYKTEQVKKTVNKMKKLLKEEGVICSDEELYVQYIQDNLERIASKDRWVPVCFDEFCSSEEIENYRELIDKNE